MLEVGHYYRFKVGKVNLIFQVTKIIEDIIYFHVIADCSDDGIIDWTGLDVDFSMGALYQSTEISKDTLVLEILKGADHAK
jgi:hypothetical protein